MSNILLPQLAWYGTSELKLSLPDSWQVELCNMAGYDRPAMKPAQIKAATSNPIGIPPIRELAKGKNEVVIIFDDMTRVTRVAEIVPFVLKELAEAGIPDDRIRFIVALGCHGALDRLDFVKKLGEDVVARFPVYNHNPFGHCTYVGTTSTYQTKVYINEEVMKCDLKITISSVVPHPTNGFGGGGKNILPGVASSETIEHNHLAVRKAIRDHRDRPIAGMGFFDNNPQHYDIDEAARLAGIDMSINCIVNMWGETVSLYAGALEPVHAAAVKEAKSHYLTPKLKDKDIIIANTFAKANEAWNGQNITYPAINTNGGDVILIANTPAGQVTHYLLGTFGNTGQGKLPLPQAVIGAPEYLKHLIVYTEYPDLAGQRFFGKSDKLLFLHRWDDVLRVLKESHGANARVAVYPNAEIQYCI
ncbi:lactate racemase domain-containing protein [Chloroflexota bacterium]